MVLWTATWLWLWLWQWLVGHTCWIWNKSPQESLIFQAIKYTIHKLTEKVYLWSLYSEVLEFSGAGAILKQQCLQPYKPSARYADGSIDITPTKRTKSRTTCAHRFTVALAIRVQCSLTEQTQLEAKDIKFTSAFLSNQHLHFTTSNTATRFQWQLCLWQKGEPCPGSTDSKLTFVLLYGNTIIQAPCNRINTKNYQRTKSQGNILRIKNPVTAWMDRPLLSFSCRSMLPFLYIEPVHRAQTQYLFISHQKLDIRMENGIHHVHIQTKRECAANFAAMHISSLISLVKIDGSVSMLKDAGIWTGGVG